METQLRGLELSRLFYEEAVRPILAADFPGLPHSAALLGTGSEVLGFDDAMSTDHSWGPRCSLFLSEDDHAKHGVRLREVLSQRLPHRFHGFPTNFTAPNPDDSGVQLLEARESGPVNHRVDVSILGWFFESYLGFDITNPIEPADWLSFPEQKLRTVAGGAVYHDDLGLAALRERFGYYPHDVWLYLLAACWARIGQEEHLMGRAGMVGDELGSSLIAGRLVRDIMRLGFMMERQYAPYPKWFGTAFARLVCAANLTPALREAQTGATWQVREAALAIAYRHIAEMHNCLGLTEPIGSTPSQFHGRPFLVINGGRFATALSARIVEPRIQAIAAKGLIGSLDLFSDNTDLVCQETWRPAIRALYT